jgi:cobalt-zinc-cadmium efflux system protein
VAVIIRGAWPIFRESLDILLESTPPGIKTSHVIQAIEQVQGVKNVHDLHIWAVEPRLVMLTCHVMVEQENTHLKDDMLGIIRKTVASEFGIHHLTIQLETQCSQQETIHCNLNDIASNGDEMEISTSHSH